MKRILALILMAVTLGSALGGCIVVPEGGYYHDHDHYHGHEHDDHD